MTQPANLRLVTEDRVSTLVAGPGATQTALDGRYGRVADVTALKGQVVDLATNVPNVPGTDMTAAIQAFLNTLSTGDELLWGKGTWRVDGTLTCTVSNLTVRLRQGCLIDRTRAAITPAWAASTAYAVGQNVRTANYTLQCTVAGTSGASAPALPAYGATVVDGGVTWQRVIAPEAAACLSFSGDNVTVKGRGAITSQPVWDGTNTAYSQGVVMFTGANPTCRDITLTNVVKYGVYFKDCNGLSRVHGLNITGNYPSAQWTEVETGHFGVCFDPGVTDSRIVMDKVWVDSCVQGWCGGNWGAGSSSGSNLGDNTFTRCWNHGIYNSGGLTDMLVHHNTFRDCSRPIVMSDNGHIVDHNTMSATSSGSTLYWSAAIQMRNAIDCQVTNNEIHGDVPPTGAAIDFSHVSGGTTITGNQCSGNTIKMTTANAGYAIRMGTTASLIMSNNQIRGNICEGMPVASTGLLSLQASLSATDTGRNVVSHNEVMLTGYNSAGSVAGIYCYSVNGPGITFNKFQLAYDAGAAQVGGGIWLAGTMTGALLAYNQFTTTAAYGANVTLRCIWENSAATVNATRIVQNPMVLDTTKATVTPFVLGPGGPVMDETGTGVPAFICGPGSKWSRTDGGAGSTFYVKETASNSATWRAV